MSFNLVNRYLTNLYCEFLSKNGFLVIMFYLCKGKQGVSLLIYDFFNNFKCRFAKRM